MKRYVYIITAVIMISFMAQGCSAVKKNVKNQDKDSEINQLKNRLADLEKEKNAEIERLLAEKQEQSRELSDLDRAKLELEKKLKIEIGNYKAKLEMTERGLLITFLAEIFFDSGKDMIKPDGQKTLTEVASVLNASASKSNIAVEGHTDNVPIKQSGWKSNWELSSARALSVVHYFIDNCNVRPRRLSAVGCGEYRPVVSNETDEGKKKNRRVEIVILPSVIEKVKPKKGE